MKRRNATDQNAATDRGLTHLLEAWSQGDRNALDHLMPRISTELHRLARNYLQKERPNHTLQPTALVNELYLRLVERREMHWRDRGHFFAFAASTMRRILVDHARHQKAAKRGSGAAALSLDSEDFELVAPGEIDLLALDEALRALARLDQRQCHIVELRAFTGLNLKQTAKVLGVSIATVSREWIAARAWLYGHLTERQPS